MSRPGAGRESEPFSTVPDGHGAAPALWRAAGWRSSATFTGSSAWASALSTPTFTQAGLISWSLSSVYWVLKRAGTLVHHPRKPKPVWTRCAKAVPGERGQMDLKYLPQGRYQLTLVDDCSRLLAATVQEESWDGVGPGPVEDWQRVLRDYVRFYNRRRLHSALGYTPPMTYALQRPPHGRISHVS